MFASPAAIVGAVVLSIRIDPRGQFNHLPARKFHIIVAPAKHADQLAGVRAIRVGRLIFGVSEGVLVDVGHQPSSAAHQVPIGPRKSPRRFARQFHFAGRIRAAVTTDTMLVKNRLYVGRVVQDPRPAYLPRLWSRLAGFSLKSQNRVGVEAV